MRDITIFIGAWAIRSAMLTIIAFGLCRWTPRLSAATQNMIWRTTFLSLAAMILVMGYAPRVNVRVAPKAAIVSYPWVNPPRILPGSSDGLSMPLSFGSATKSSVRPSLPSIGNRTNHVAFEDAVGVVYLLGCLFLLGRWASSWIGILQIARRAIPTHAYKDARLAQDPSLLVPVVFGIRNPTILLPLEASGWLPDRLELVLQHERSHADRHDWVWQTFAWFIAITQWFNPLAWLALSQLRATAEQTADDFVVGLGALPSQYCSALLDSVRQIGGHGGVAVGLAQNPKIKIRLERILDRTLNRKPLVLGWRLGVEAAFGVVSFFLACLAPFDAPTIVLNSVFRPSPYSDRFSDGSVPKITRIMSGGLGNVKWWNMNGHIEAQPDKHHFRTRGPGFSYTSNPLEFYFQVSGISSASVKIPESAPHFAMRVGHLFDGRCNSGGFEGETWPMMSKASQDTTELFGHQSFQFSKSLKSADVEIGMAKGAFQKVATWADGRGDFTVRITQDQRLTGKLGPHGIGVTKQASRIFVTVPLRFVYKDFKVMVLGRDGTIETPMMSPATSGWIKDSGFESIGVCNQSPTQLKRIELWTRDFEWVTIKNVPLEPKP